MNSVCKDFNYFSGQYNPNIVWHLSAAYYTVKSECPEDVTWIVHGTWAVELITRPHNPFLSWDNGITCETADWRVWLGEWTGDCTYTVHWKSIDALHLSFITTYKTASSAVPPNDCLSSNDCSLLFPNNLMSETTQEHCKDRQKRSSTWSVQDSVQKSKSAGESAEGAAESTRCTAESAA